METNAKQQEQSVMNEMLQQSRKLQAKYSEYINPLRESFKRKGKPLDETVLAATLTCLEEFKARTKGMNEATKAINVGTFIQHGYDLIVAVYPNLVLNNIASIQPLNNRSGEIWFYNVVYDQTKGGVTAGTAGLSSTQGPRPNMRYSSELVPLTVTGTIDGTNAAFSATATQAIRTTAGTDGIFATDGKEVFVFNAAGTALVGSLGGSGTYNSGTGAIALTFNTAPSVGAGVVIMAKYDFESNPSQIGKSKLTLTSIPIVAQKHALTTEYTLDAEYDISRNFNMNISDELIKGTAALIRAEIDQLGMYEIKLTAMRPDLSAGASNTWNASVPSGVAQLDHYRTLLTMWKNQSNQIYGATRMVHGNFAIVGNDISTVIEILPEFKPSASVGADLQNAGPYVAGTIGNFIVIKNPDFAANEWVIGNKGIGTFNSGYILAPYRGLMVTPPISNIESVFNVTRGMYLEAGRQVVNGKFYSYGKATNLTF